MKKLRITFKAFGMATLLMALIFTNLPAAAAQPSSANQPLGASATPITFTALSAGLNITCGVTSSGGARCWGINDRGGLGDGTNITRPSPVDVFGLTSAVSAISTGYLHSCALTTSGGVKCWGANDQGQLGDGTSLDKNKPVDVSGLTSGVIAISASYNHTCAVTSSGGVKCWGANDLGQLGDGTTLQSLTPVDVAGLSDVSAVSAGLSFTCALTTSGAVKCWGNNGNGELGDGTNTDSLVPVEVSGLSGVTDFSANTDHTCAVAGGGAKCWGANTYGQLGDSTRLSRNTPVDVTGLTSGIATISAGRFHSCALSASGSVSCWGYNNWGELGNGTLISSNTPVAVTGLPAGIIKISSGGKHSCALTADGTGKCWGSNSSGELGNGKFTNSSIPVTVVLTTPIPFKKISPASRSINQARPVISWNALDGVNVVTVYEYCYDTTNDNKCAAWLSNGRSTSKTLTGLGSGLTYYWQVRARNSNGFTYADNSPTAFWSFKTNYFTTFRSTAAEDGWVLESSETSGKAAYLDRTGALLVGDDEYQSQYRSLLSFNTSSLPDNARVTRVSLKVKTSLITGPNPFSTLGPLLVDIRPGFFGASPALELADFQAAASLYIAGSLGPVSGEPGWYESILKPTSYRFINRLGTTQFRLRFALDDNDDDNADVVSIYAGNVTNVTLRPQLVVEYTLP